MKLEKKLNNYIELINNDIDYYKQKECRDAIDELMNGNDIQILEEVREDLIEILGNRFEEE